MFEHVKPYAGDPILSLMERFLRDPRPHKINLSIGYYYDENGQVPPLRTVNTTREALREIWRNASLYLPMEGLPALRDGIRELLFGPQTEGVAHERIATVQTVGGSGALKLGADFLKRHFPQSAVWVSDPTWENHVGIFSAAGFEVNAYPYFDARTGGVDDTAMFDVLERLPPASILVLHPCCHNPTGADLSPGQWDRLVDLVERQRLIPFLDMAYQGFGGGLEANAAPVRALARRGLPFLVAHSFSKIFSLYGERIGGLSVHCENAAVAEWVLGQLKLGVRSLYSSPPRCGGEIVARILSDHTLRSDWMSELDGMRQRLLRARAGLARALAERAPGHDFGYLERQRGLFSYTGLRPDQVVRLREEHGVYLLESGRLCVGGLNHGNIGRVADAIVAVL